LGLLKCHILDALPQVGGQLSELYPKSPSTIFLISEVSRFMGNLMEQIKQFEPGFTLERAETIENKRMGLLLLP
jgi:thioredoxin reductase (NADPH)